MLSIDNGLKDMDIVSIAIITCIAAIVGTVLGFGTSTILVPILSLFLPIPEVLLLTGIIHWFGDVWKIGLFREGLEWRIIAIFCISGLLLSILGALLVNQLPVEFLTKALGVALIFYVFFIAFKPTLNLNPSNKNLLLGGALSGFFAGLYGIGGAIRGAFLNLFNLPKAVYIATNGAIALVIDSGRIGAYYMGGSALSSRLFYGLLIFIPVSLLGAYIAKFIVHRIPQRQFRLLIAIFLGLIGLRLLFIA